MAAIGLYSEDGTRFDDFAIQQYVTRSALAGIAADICARQAKRLPQVMHEQEPGFNVARTLCPVDGYGNLSHTSLLKNDKVKSDKANKERVST
jgi:hypothetical protein